MVVEEEGKEQDIKKCDKCDMSHLSHVTCHTLADKLRTKAAREPEEIRRRAAHQKASTRTGEQHGVGGGSITA